MIEHLLVALAVDGDDVRIDDVARFAAVNRRMHVIAHRTLLPMPLAMTVHLPRRLFACGEVRPTLGDALDYTREMARSSNAGYWTGLAAVVEIGRRCVLQAYVRWTWSTKVKRRNSAARPLALNTIATGPSADALASWAASSGRALMARGEPSIFGAQLHAATGKNHTLEGLKLARLYARSAVPVGRPFDPTTADDRDTLALLLANARSEMIGSISGIELCREFGLQPDTVESWLIRARAPHGEWCPYWVPRLDGMRPPPPIAEALARPESLGVLVGWIDSSIQQAMARDCPSAAARAHAFFPRPSDFIDLSRVYLVPIKGPSQPTLGHLGIVVVR